MATYSIEPERRTLHGHFSRDLSPVLTIQPGDTVVFRTLDASWYVEPFGKRFEPRHPVLDDGHALCGPVAIAGAEPGMTLAVRFDAIEPGDWAWSVGGGWPSPVNTRLGVEATPPNTHLWERDGDLWRNQHGHTVRSRPFMGVSGIAPGEPSIHSTTPPRNVGGNMDCKELVAGSTLYLPIAAPGALFSTGDGHGVQGDGEVSGVAIECPMERVAITFDLLPDLSLTTPRADTPAGWLTFGFHEDLNEAMYIALEAMIDLLMERLKLERTDALALASLTVDLRITQVVNMVRGVHAIISHDALPGLSAA